MQLAKRCVVMLWNETYGINMCISYKYVLPAAVQIKQGVGIA